MTWSERRADRQADRPRPNPRPAAPLRGHASESVHGVGESW
jgi:hypothetical protein